MDDASMKLEEQNSQLLNFPKNSNEINKEWLMSILKLKYHTNEIDIIKFEIMNLISGRDNYLSVVTRTKIVCRNRNNPTEEHLIIKFTPPEENVRIFLTEILVFQREVEIYNVVRKEFSKCDELRKIGICFPGPSCYLAKIEETYGTIVLEDLQYQYWSTLQVRQMECDERHCDAVLEKLAQFHMATHWMIQERIISETNNVVLYDQGGRRFPFTLLEKIFDTFLDILDHTEKYSLFCESLRKFREKKLNEGKITESIRTGWDFVTLIHGDCRNSNIFFHYDNGTNEAPTDVSLVDWQLSKIASPLNDLTYFFCTSSDKRVKLNLKPRLKFYYDSVKAISEKLQLNVFNMSVESFYEKFREQLKYEIACSCLTIYAAFMNVHESVKSFEQLSSICEQAKMNAMSDNPPGGTKLILDIADILIQWNVYEE